MQWPAALALLTVQILELFLCFFCVAPKRVSKATIHREWFYILLAVGGHFVSTTLYITIPSLFHELGNSPIPRLFRSLFLPLFISPLLLRSFRIVFIVRGYQKSIVSRDGGLWTEKMQKALQFTSWRRLRWMYVSLLVVHLAVGLIAFSKDHCSETNNNPTEHPTIHDNNNNNNNHHQLTKHSSNSAFCVSSNIEAHVWTLTSWLDIWDFTCSSVYCLLILTCVSYLCAWRVVGELVMSHISLAFMVGSVWVLGSVAPTSPSAELLSAVIVVAMAPLYQINAIVRISLCCGDHALGFNPRSQISGTMLDETPVHKIESSKPYNALTEDQFAGVTLDMVLEDEATRNAFKAHLAKEFSSENLIVYQELNSLLRVVETHTFEALLRAQILHEKYLLPTSALLVNIPPNICSELGEAICEVFVLASIKQAKEVYYNNLHLINQRSKLKSAQASSHVTPASSSTTTTTSGTANDMTTPLNPSMMTCVSNPSSNNLSSVFSSPSSVVVVVGGAHHHNHNHNHNHRTKRSSAPDIRLGRDFFLSFSSPLSERAVAVDSNGNNDNNIGGGDTRFVVKTTELASFEPEVSSGSPNSDDHDCNSDLGRNFNAARSASVCEQYLSEISNDALASLGVKLNVSCPEVVRFKEALELVREHVYALISHDSLIRFLVSPKLKEIVLERGNPWLAMVRRSRERRAVGGETP